MSLTTSALKYVGLPVAVGGALTAMDRPYSPYQKDTEELPHLASRLNAGWTGGGAVAGGLLSHKLLKGLPAKYQILGNLAGVGAGAALGHEYGTPISMHRAMAKRMAKLRFPNGVDPRTGLEPHLLEEMAPVTEGELNRINRWGV